VCTYACSCSSGTPFRRGSSAHGLAPRTGRLSHQRTGGAFGGVSRCRSAPSRPGDGARTELAEFPRFRSAENECVDAPACASGCESARESGVGGEARPRGEEKDEPREREREGSSTFDEGSACVGVADGEGVCAGLSGDAVLPVIVEDESDDAIDGGGRGRSGLALMVYMLCDGRVVKLCRQRRRWAGGPSTLRAPYFARAAHNGRDVACPDAHSSGSTWRVLAAPEQRRRSSAGSSQKTVVAPRTATGASCLLHPPAAT
jgi:hypothetical protein